MVVREDVLEGLGDDICRDGLLDEGSVGDDARQGALELADVAVDAIGDEHQDIVRHVDMVEPVSYTHLDVYKRQSLCFRALAPLAGALLDRVLQRIRKTLPYAPPKMAVIGQDLAC